MYTFFAVATVVCLIVFILSLILGLEKTSFPFLIFTFFFFVGYSFSDNLIETNRYQIEQYEVTVENNNRQANLVLKNGTKMEIYFNKLIEDGEISYIIEYENPHFFRSLSIGGKSYDLIIPKEKTD